MSSDVDDNDDEMVTRSSSTEIFATFPNELQWFRFFFLLYTQVCTKYLLNVRGVYMLFCLELECTDCAHFFLFCFASVNCDGVDGHL